MKKKTNYSKLSGQALSDASARMMGWRRDDDTGFYWVTGKKGDETVHSNFSGWRPHENYNQCRIVEDWIDERAWKLFTLKLPQLYELDLLRSTCEERLRAALMAWEDSK